MYLYNYVNLYYFVKHHKDFILELFSLSQNIMVRFKTVSSIYRFMLDHFIPNGLPRSRLSENSGGIYVCVYILECF